MRSPDQIFQELEADRLQREREVRLVDNIATKAVVAEEQSMLLRSLVLLTYAHLEGFCKFALLAYTSALNATQLNCREATAPIVAASLRNALRALRNPSSKCPEFRNDGASPPDLDIIWRERMFVKHHDEILNRPIDIPDSAVDTEHNLKSKVLKQNLYRLGLEH